MRSLALALTCLFLSSCGSGDERLPYPPSPWHVHLEQPPGPEPRPTTYSCLMRDDGTAVSVGTEPAWCSASGTYGIWVR
jgi:hypothetical protein